MFLHQKYVRWLDVVVRDLKLRAMREHADDGPPKVEQISRTKAFLHLLAAFVDHLLKVLVCLLHDDEDVRSRLLAVLWTFGLDFTLLLLLLFAIKRDATTRIIVALIFSLIDLDSSKIMHLKNILMLQQLHVVKLVLGVLLKLRVVDLHN